MTAKNPSPHELDIKALIRQQQLRDKEIKLLKKAVRAQSKMLMNMRIGLSRMPDWVFADLNKCADFYKVANVGDIK